MHLFKFLRMSLNRFILINIKCIYLKYMNLGKIWLVVVVPIFNQLKYMRLKPIGFIDDKYINLVIVYLKHLFNSTITEVFPVS